MALLSYRGKPTVGGQGVYVRHLSRALTDLGHHVEVLGGQPYPDLDDRVRLVELPSLDIYNDHYPMRMPALWEIDSLADWLEVTTFCWGSFPEPLAFSLRAFQHLRRRVPDFDIVQDNQSLGYGLLGIEWTGLPVLSTIHHPITVDRRLELAHATTRRQWIARARWYGFTRMQTRVARRMARIMTVSESSRHDIHTDHGVPLERIHVVPVGVDAEVFCPLPQVRRRPDLVVTTASADVAMKGLVHLFEAIAKLRVEHPLELVVIGRPKRDGASYLR